MANTDPSTMSLPPPPSTYATAPGQQPYDTNPLREQGGQSHMPPPPLPPVVIPQNQNPIPTAVTPGQDGQAGSVLSPGSATSSTGVRRAAPEPNKRALYVGGLDPRVTEDILRQIFETTGHVQNVKIIPDKNMSAVSSFAILSVPPTPLGISPLPLMCIMLVVRVSHFLSNLSL